MPQNDEGTCPVCLRGDVDVNVDVDVDVCVISSTWHVLSCTTCPKIRVFAQ